MVHTVFLGSGGFPAFWYHVGYVTRLREITNKTVCCGGTSGGAMAAWVLAHTNVSKDRLVRIAEQCIQQLHYYTPFDKWAQLFMSLVTENCGPFVGALYAGAYATRLNNRTPILLRTSDIQMDVRESCFVPVLSGHVSGPRGYVDGRLGWTPTYPAGTHYIHYSDLYPVHRLLPLRAHADNFEAGINACDGGGLHDQMH